MATFHDFNVVLISQLHKLMMYLLANETNSVNIQTCTNAVLCFLDPNWEGEPLLMATVTQCCVTQLFLGQVFITAAKDTIQTAMLRQVSRKFPKWQI